MSERALFLSIASLSLLTRMSYRGRGGSGSSTPTRNGRGGAPAGRGRGRGRGIQLNDMTSMALDYESKVNIADKSSILESQDTVSHTVGPSRPANGSSNSFAGHAAGHRQVPAIDNAQQAASSSNSNRTPYMHHNQGPRRAFKPFNASSSSGYNPYAPQSGQGQQASPYNKSNGFQHGRAHTGIGAGNRKPESLGHDPSLTRPITFVKAVNVMQPTMDKEEHDRLCELTMRPILLSSSRLMCNRDSGQAASRRSIQVRCRTLISTYRTASSACSCPSPSRNKKRSHVSGHFACFFWLKRLLSFESIVTARCCIYTA